MKKSRSGIKRDVWKINQAKEFYDYCMAHPEVMQKLRSMKSEELSKYVESLGFSLDGESLREFMELCTESNDEELAAVVSGGMCIGHCGHTEEGSMLICYSEV